MGAGAGGNCVDAAVAMAAAINMAEPISTGIGGDAFCLYYDKASGTVSGMNASGRAPAALNIDVMKETTGRSFPDPMPSPGNHTPQPRPDLAADGLAKIVWTHLRLFALFV